MAIKKKTKDPREMHPKPPQPKREQEYPGLESEMSPRPDYGRDSYVGTGRLKDKTAVITGADSGIGRSVAVLFAKEGADIVVSYLSEHSDAKETQEAIEEAGRKCILIPGDIGEEKHCHKIIKDTVKEFGKVDIMVNNAAYQMKQDSIMGFTTEELDRHYKSNVYPLFYFAQASLPYMKPGSSFINTTSIQAYQPSENLLAYATTKAVIINFTRGFAKEAIKKGIRVNAVAPGPVWTPLIPAAMGEESAESFGKQTVFGRTAQPVELATLFVFLASDEASFVTGQTFGATGELMP